MIKLISFDLQGTISNSNFSDTFWLKILPEKYSKHYNIGIQEAKDNLKNFFKEVGKYDFKYYDEKYWENLLNFNTKYELEKIDKPKLDLKILDFISKSKIPCVIFSTTTHTFIDFELGEYQALFKTCISTLEDFHIAGKPAIAFKKLATMFKIDPQEILHIGDNLEMDIKNPQTAGCKTLLYEDNLYKKLTKFLLKREGNDYSN